MKVRYDKETDVLYISFNDKIVLESDEEKPGIIIDYAEDKSIVGIEVLEASKKMPEPNAIEYMMA